MKRDMDLIRELLLKLEIFESEFGSTYLLELGEDPLDGFSENPDVILSHLGLIAEAGLIDGSPSINNGNLIFKSITWAGHDFLDSVRDPEVWRKTQEGALAVGGLTFDLLKDLAKAYAKKLITEKTGIDL